MQLLGDKSCYLYLSTLTSGDRTENMHEMFTVSRVSDEEWNIIKEECVSKGLELSLHVILKAQLKG